MVFSCLLNFYFKKCQKLQKSNIKKGVGRTENVFDYFNRRNFENISYLTISELYFLFLINHMD